MNRKKILQILLAASTLAGGITMSHTIVNAAPIDKNDNNLIQGTLSRVNVIKAQVVNVSTNLRVRSSSSINSTVLGYLNNGTNIEVVGEEGDWYKIKFNGEIAYVSKEYVNIENGLSTASLSISGKGQVVNVSSELRIRQAASTSSAIIGTLKNGETFDIISKSGGWYNIKTGSIIGFVSGEYVKEIQSTSSSESSSGSTTNLNGTVVNVSSNLRVRAGASTSTSVLGYLLNGEKVNVIGEEGNWYKIKYNNTTGYVAKEYIQVSGGTSTTPSAPETPSTPSAPEATNKTGKVINISSNLNVRSGAGTNYSVIGYLYNGNTVTITGESGNWYAISYNGTTGYVAKEYIQVSGDTSTTPSTPETPSTGGETNVSNQKGKVINVSSNLRVRKEPNTSSEVLGYLLCGDIVEITGKTSDWYKINFRGQVGYVSDEYIQIVDSSTEGTKPSTGNTYSIILNAMKAHLGTPYVWGGSGEYLTTALLNKLSGIYPTQAANGAYTRARAYADKGYRAFDCSGLMQWGFAQAGVRIGRSTWDQILNGVEVPISQVQPGDLLFYSNLNHVGMYIGNGQWIEAPNKNADVRIVSVPWNLVTRARRVLN